MSRVKEIWDQGAAFLDAIYANNIPYHTSHAVIADLLPKDRPIEVLDLGAGTGLLAQRILERISRSRVTCLEFSTNMIEQAKRRLRPFDGRAVFVCQDMMTWETEHGYDAVVACNSLVYKEINLGECYKKYGKVLNKSGLMLNSTPVKTDDLPLLTQFAKNMRPPDAPPFPREALDFAKNTGQPISHFGPDSLAFAVTTEDHLKLICEAGLTGSCPWRYLSQAVLAGVWRNG